MPYKDREIQLQAQKTHYNKNKEKFINRNKERRNKRKEWYQEFMSTRCCIVCQENSLECLDWHHLDPKEKDGQVGKMLNHFRSMENVFSEMNKCIILCANCHRKYHAGNLEFGTTERIRTDIILLEGQVS